jgi:hypothetical protein
VTDVTVSGTQGITPHNQGLFEAGKQMLVDSVSVGREFCKFMVGVSSGAVPVYLALLALALPKDYRPVWWWKGVVLVVPGLVFLVASAVFAFGVFPRTDTFSLDVPAEIEKARNDAMSTRGLLSTAGFVLFGIGTLASIVMVIGALRVQAPAAPPAKPIQVQLVKP